MAEMATPGAVPIPANEQVATATDASATVAARMEAFPLSRWHLKARIIVGSATFFDAVDTVAIGLVLPVIGQAWHMTPEQIGWKRRGNRGVRPRDASASLGVIDRCQKVREVPDRGRQAKLRVGHGNQERACHRSQMLAVGIISRKQLR